MPRQFFEDGMEITYQDLNDISASLQRGLYDRLLYQLLLRKKDVFFGDSLLVEYSNATEVTVKAGLGIQEDTSKSAPENQMRPIYLDSSQTLTIDTPDNSDPRKDIVVIKSELKTSQTGSRKYKSPTDSSVSTETLDIRKDYDDPDLKIVKGTAASSPSEPSVPSGYIKLAVLDVAASTGMSGSSDVTDSRTKAPVAGEYFLDTSSLNQLTAGAETSLSTLMSDIDGLIGGGGGGGGLQWTAPAGDGALEDEEYGLSVYRFDPDYGKNQKVVVGIKVPSTYVAGTKITAKVAQYSPSSDSSSQILKTRSYLVRPGTDAISSTSNKHDSTNSGKTSDAADEAKIETIDLTDGSGQCGGTAVSAGDVLRVELFRDTDTDTDTADVRFVPSLTSVSFI